MASVASKENIVGARHLLYFLDFSLPDSWGSRLDNDWVLAALGTGLHDAYDIWTPFGTFNPLDTFSDSAASRAFGRPRNVPASMAIGFGGRVAFSFKRTFQTIGRSGKLVSSTVSYFQHPNFLKKGLSVLRFNSRDIAYELKPKNPTNLATLSHRKSPIDAARDKDIVNATKQLQSDIAKGTISGRGYRLDTGSGAVWINNIPMTWHHDIKKGHMQLVTRELHQATQAGGNHLGLAYWWDFSKYL